MLYSQTPPKNGFTLIELSIVLVIIGLIVGGILVGRDLISAAEIRAAISQVEKYNAAVKTFRLKYNGLPGDIPYAQANSLGFFAFTGANAGLSGMGDGNGLLDVPASAIMETGCGGEGLAFWRHLSDAKLIDGSYGNGTNISTSTGQATLTDPSQLQLLVPSPKAGHGNYIFVGALSKISFGATPRPIAYANYFIIQPTYVMAGDGSCDTGPGGLTPIQAFTIDTKVDDGMPNTGAVLSLYNGADNIGEAVNSPPSAAPTSTNNTCNIGDGMARTDTYNISNTTGGNDQSCGMIIRFN